MATAKKKTEEPLQEEAVSFPNVNIPTVTEEPKEQPIAEAVVSAEPKADSDEVLFLKNILQIQHEGGFGRHLDNLIYDRIKLLS